MAMSPCKLLFLLACQLLLVHSSATTAANDASTTDTSSVSNMRQLGGFDAESLPLFEDISYFNFDESILLQAIMPGLRFDSYGTITSYSGLAVFNAVPSFIQFLNHRISFTVWRPRGQGLYDIVGHNELKFTPAEIRKGMLEIDNSTGSVPEDFAFFNFSDREPETNDALSLIQPNGPITFQPSDVLGWNTYDPNADKPLSLVYRESANSPDAFNGFSFQSPKQAVCSVSECDARAKNLSSIIPYLSVKFRTVNMPPSNISLLMCESSAPTTLTPCTAPTTTPETTVNQTIVTSIPTCVGDNCNDNGASRIIIIIAPAVVTVGVLLLVFALVFAFLVAYRAKKKERYLVKLRSGKDKYQLEDNPTYDSTGQGVMNHSTDKLHFETEDGDLYAIPSNVRRDTASARSTKDLDGLFDGECYASTYQTNGQCHIYQELPESATAAAIAAVGTTATATATATAATPAAVAATSSSNRRPRSKSMVASHEVLGRPTTRTLPLRITASSASVSKFPYTMPNTPATSVFELESGEKPSFGVFPYAEVRRPNTALSCNRKTSTMSPFSESRPSTSFLETKVPSTSTMTFTSEDTPPSSATVVVESNGAGGPMIRKLFHAVDDELLRVPNALEREELQTLDNPEEIYSKLKHSYTKQKRNSVDAVFMDQPDQYWAPPSDPSELYDQLAKRKFREIQRKQIRVTDCIGGGNFGTVYKGLWQVPGGVMPVAVKTLNIDSPGTSEGKFLKEAAIMGQFLHTNVVKLLGVVTVGEPLMIVLELMPKGDLKRYLRNLNHGEELPSLLLSFCRQIGYGMNYLANKAFVHRDLAARNILLTDDLTCKIGDFGMSRDLEEETVYFSQGGKLPVRWTAPEALKYHQFSSASDVWSYGMLLFEIWSLGKKPFDAIQTKRLMAMVSSGFCQPPPPGCPRAIYKMMVECWHTEAEKRTTFSRICSYLNSSSNANSLLAWSREDSAVSPKVRELGAPLSAARKLYVDLQFTYTNSLV